MKKLEDIDKKQIFEVPEGYFDKLPLRIQERVSKPQSSFSWMRSASFRFAVPVLAVLAVAFIWFNPLSKTTIEEELESINETELLAFIQDSEFNSEELEAAFLLDEEDVDALEENVLGTFDSSEELIDNLLEDYTIETENF
jgi:hypothetical protein